ncbi:flagellar assembly protein FliW [bacterium]|nr:flagellar assembly protein FliW [bacterium]MBU1025578.1 flagellar assembly protein FliW [bacterium]
MLSEIIQSRENSPIRLKSTRFGKLAIRPEFIWNFPEGLIGFRNCHRFALINAAKDDESESLFAWMQSIERENLAFPVMNPLAVFPDYVIRQDEPGIIMRGIDKSDGEYQLLVIVTVPERDPKGITANLAAPLILQPKNKTAWQVILEKGPYKVSQPLFAERCSKTDKYDILVSVGSYAPPVRIKREAAEKKEVQLIDSATIRLEEVVSPPESA